MVSRTPSKRCAVRAFPLSFTSVGMPIRISSRDSKISFPKTLPSFVSSCTLRRHRTRWWRFSPISTSDSRSNKERASTGKFVSPNKALTYILGGLALVMTETAGHRPLIEALGEASIHYAPGDVDTLASGLTRLADERSFLERCRHASWEAADRRWHWEPTEERGRLVRLFAFEE